MSTTSTSRAGSLEAGDTRREAGPWWRDAVVYQVYVRSFADSDGDGIGDLAGIIDRLDHLETLGVDAVWLTPCYPSPQLDHGYDVADYFDVEPMYGDLSTFDRLIEAAKARSIRVLMDVVPNHCSSQHAWFQAALAAAPGSPERARFTFRNGRGPNGAEPPNNWRSVFGGPTWTRVAEADGSPGQWYLHTFSPWQPDFDWSCPDVVEMFDAMLTFWFDRGVDGFRVDAVAVVGKAPGLPDAPPPPPGTAENDVWSHNPYTVFWPTAHEHWRGWRSLVDRYENEHPGRELVTVSEAYTPDRPDLLLQYVNPEEFHQSFCFDLMLAPWRVDTIRNTIEPVYDTLSASGAPLTWTINNHDTQRSVTRYGRADATELSSWTKNNLVYTGTPVDLALGTVRARAAITLTAALPGSLYLFQGEELGLPEVLDLPDSARQDPIFERTNGREPGRDGCRVPLPWTADQTTSFGFSSGPSMPWLPQPDDWGAYNVAVQQRDPDSMLSLYHHLLSARRARLDPDAGLSFVDVEHPDLLLIHRGQVVVALNVGSTEIDLPALVPALAGSLVLISSAVGHDDAARLPANTCCWLVPA
jgi:alpha-glucosidase